MASRSSRALSRPQGMKERAGKVRRRSIDGVKSVDNVLLVKPAE